ncbi:protein of unknown function [Agrobacterium pusense]|uniref:Uncharacterized protein n=1 Tax=Agrobacterium pusense TaxID=648995 RepID=U4Q3D2_9HYPH|nr:protein of unknown function [Agrobacterium pusense]
MLEELQAGLAVLGKQGQVPITFHRIFEQAALDGIVVYHKNMRGHF